jgi:uncharacterized membrane protein
MKYYLVLYVSTLLVMGVLDGIWLGVIAKDFYRGYMGDQFEFHRVPALVFYLMYAVGILVFVSAGPAATSWQQVLIYGALFGMLAFATYDLTNLATLRGWSLTMSLVDIAWGTFNTGVSATLGWLLARCILR